MKIVIAVVAMSAILGLAGCAQPQPEVAAPEPEQESTATPASAPPSRVMLDAEWSNQSSAGYTWDSAVTIFVGPVASDVTNAPPGFTDVIVGIKANGFTENSTPGRSLPDSSRAWYAWVAYPVESAACTLLPTYAAVDDGGVFGMRFQVSNATHCFWLRGALVEAGGLAPAGSAEMQWLTDPDGREPFVDPWLVAQVPESEAPAIVEALSQPSGMIVGAASYFAEKDPAPDYIPVCTPSAPTRTATGTPVTNVVAAIAISPGLACD